MKTDISINLELLKYGDKRLYQYNKDDFFIYVLIVNKLFSNYKFTSNQREAFLLINSLDFYVFVYPCCLTA